MPKAWMLLHVLRMALEPKQPKSRMPEAEPEPRMHSDGSVDVHGARSAQERLRRESRLMAEGQKGGKSSSGECFKCCDPERQAVILLPTVRTFGALAWSCTCARFAWTLGSLAMTTER